MIKNYSNIKSLKQSNVSLTYSSGKNVSELIKTYNTSESFRSHEKFSRDKILKATNDLNRLQIIEISRHFYSSAPLYTQYVNYYATLFPYYWAIFPKMTKKSTKKPDIPAWFDALSYVEMINPELNFVDIARKVLIDGSCYIAVKDSEEKKGRKFGIQILPIKYCRSNKTYKGRSIVDFDVTYFDTLPKKRLAEALLTFPPEVVKAYHDYKNLKEQSPEAEWQSINVDYAYKFTLRDDDLPLIYGVVLDLLDLQDAKDITMFKIEQEVSKILVQKFGVDNQGQPIISLPELQEFQRDTKGALSSIPGLDVMTTYADVSVESMQKASSVTSTDSPISQIAKDSYESSGVSTKLISSDNAGTLGKAIILNESVMRYLLLQFRDFLQVRLDSYTKDKKTSYSVEMPDVSRFNWKDKFDVYINKNNLFSSSMLAQVISGRRQSDIMSAYYFEEALVSDGSETADSAVASTKVPTGNTNTEPATATTKNSGASASGNVGRPELPDDQKSEKTLQNRESL